MGARETPPRNRHERGNRESGRGVVRVESRARATKEIFGVASRASGWRTGGRDALSGVFRVDVRAWAGRMFPRRERRGDIWWVGGCHGEIGSAVRVHRPRHPVNGAPRPQTAEPISLLCLRPSLRTNSHRGSRRNTQGGREEGWREWGERAVGVESGFSAQEPRREARGCRPEAARGGAPNSLFRGLRNLRFRRCRLLRKHYVMLEPHNLGLRCDSVRFQPHSIESLKGIRRYGAIWLVLGVGLFLLRAQRAQRVLHASVRQRSWRFSWGLS